MFKEALERWDFIQDLETTKLLQFHQQHPREKGGSSKGFTLLPDQSLTLLQMLDNPELKAHAEAMIAQIRQLASELDRLEL